MSSPISHTPKFTYGKYIRLSTKPWDKIILNGVEFPKVLPDADTTIRRALFEKLIKSGINTPCNFVAVGKLPLTYTVSRAPSRG